MDTEELQAIRHRADAATAGPWKVVKWRGLWAVTKPGTWQPRREDSEFAVHARDDVTALCDEVARLTLALERLTAKYETDTAEARRVLVRWVNGPEAGG